MKYVIIILLIAVAKKIDSAFVVNDFLYNLGKAALDDKLKSFLEDLKTKLKTGDVDLGIPVLDPFESEYQEINITESDIRVMGELKDINVDGLSEYLVNDAKFKIAGLQMKVNLTWSNVTIKSLYNFYDELPPALTFSFYGKGDICVRISDFTFDAEAKLGIKSGKVFVKDLSTYITLKAINLQSSGFYNNEGASRTIDAIVSSSLPTAIDYHHWLIKEEIDSRLKNLLNIYLENVTLQDIINVIG